MGVYPHRQTVFNVKSISGCAFALHGSFRGKTLTNQESPIPKILM